MKIFILQKSITDLKNPIIKKEYETSALTIRDLITEMVTKNYKNYKKGILEDHITNALEQFIDGSFYIVNQSKNIKYINLDEDLNISCDDELVLIKLKYIRGFVWML